MGTARAAHTNIPISPQKWEQHKRIKNHNKRLEIISRFMTSLLQKNYEDAMMLCMIGLKCEPKNQLLQDYYHLLSEKLEENEYHSSSDISSDEDDEEGNKNEEKPENNKKHIITKNLLEKAHASNAQGISKEEDADSSGSTTTSEDEDSETSNEFSSESDDFELEVSECSTAKVRELRSKVVQSRPPAKLNPQWLPH